MAFISTLKGTIFCTFLWKSTFKSAKNSTLKSTICSSDPYSKSTLSGPGQSGPTKASDIRGPAKATELLGSKPITDLVLT